MIRRPWLTVLLWLVASGLVLLLAPNLTRLAAESFGVLLPDSAGSVQAQEIIRQTWPNESQGSVAVVVLDRSTGLTPEDHEYAKNLARRFLEARATLDDPGSIIQVLGPDSDPLIAERLISKDKTTQLVIAGLDSDWVAPRADELVRALQDASASLKVPNGLRQTWSGDAAIGSAYMDSVRKTLDRASVVVVVLVLTILLIVYRSFLLSLVPLLTIGLSLLIARGLVAWMDVGLGVEANPLVELFLVAVLFGSGTDLVLLLTWRFSEAWNGLEPPEEALIRTRRNQATAMLSSAGTLILALCLLGFARFKLFNQTGPCVAVGMTVGLFASMTLAPALLLLLARHAPGAFAGFRRPSTGFWQRIGRFSMARPRLGWALGVGLLAVPAIHALRVPTSYDMVRELPPSTPALQGMQDIVEHFGPDEVSPLTIVLRSSQDWRDSIGLYTLDDLSARLNDYPQFGEVRSATQPLGSREELQQARIGSRLTAIQEGLGKIGDGATLMSKSFTEEAAKIRILQNVQRLTGFGIPGFGSSSPAPPANSNSTDPPAESTEALQARTMLEKLGQAAAGAQMIAQGTALAQKELGIVIENPAGMQAVDRLLLTPENIADHPDLEKAFNAYMSPDGKTTRIEVGTVARMHSTEALDLADELIERAENLDLEQRRRDFQIWMTGPNIVMAEVRRITNEDMRWAFLLIPLGIFLTLFVLLRDFGVCVNLVLTMLLTYGFTIGLTDWLFQWLRGTEGLDWKVKFFTFVILMACGVDYNIFLVSSIREESAIHGLREGITRAIGSSGALITSAGAITVCSYLAFLVSPLDSLRGLGFAVALGITIDALLVRTIIMPCGHWLMFRHYVHLCPDEPREEGTVVTAGLDQK